MGIRVDKSGIDYIRKKYLVQADVTDDEIERIAENLLKAWSSMNLDLIGRRIELNLLIKGIAGVKKNYVANGLERQLLSDCEWSYVFGLFGPCCIWTRATLEHIMQTDCLRMPGVDETFKNKIREQIRTGEKSPEIIAMEGQLKKARTWTKEDHKTLETIVRNGNALVHHRYDKIDDGKTHPFFRTQFGTIRIKIDGEAIMPPDDRATREHNRPWIEKEMAKVSMRELYGLFWRKRCYDEI